MSTPLPLRRRVALALTALGFLLSALFAAATIAVTEDYEHVLASEILRGQAEDYGLRLSNGLPAQLPKLEAAALQQLAARGWQPDYLTVRRRADLLPPQAGDGAGALVVLGAARLGATRLIDNLEV